jgi:hypothetical protein
MTLKNTRSSPLKNIITTWDTDLGTIPEGWHLCDGTDGSPLLNVSRTCLKAYRNINIQAIPPATYTKLALNAKDFDLLSEFDQVTNYRFTALTAGYYFVSASVRWETSPAGVLFYTSFVKTGAYVAWRSLKAVGGSTFSTHCSCLLQMAPGNYIEAWVQHSHTSALNVKEGNLFTWLSIHKIADVSPVSPTLRYMIKL